MTGRKIKASGPKVVRWEDTTNIAEWSTPEEVAAFAADGSWICENVGWVVHEDDDCVVVAARRTLDGRHFGLFERIPKRAIIEEGGTVNERS